MSSGEDELKQARELLAQWASKEKGRRVFLSVEEPSPNDTTGGRQLDAVLLAMTWAPMVESDSPSEGTRAEQG